MTLYDGRSKFDLIVFRKAGRFAQLVDQGSLLRLCRSQPLGMLPGFFRLFESHLLLDFLRSRQQIVDIRGHSGSS